LILRAARWLGAGMLAADSPLSLSKRLRGAAAVRWLGVGVLTAGTAIVARWLRSAIETRPVAHEPGPSRIADPAAARAEQRLADTLLWRLVERRIALRALQPFRQRPTFKPPVVLNLDHGPGGVASALAAILPLDATLVAVDSAPGMAALARNRLRRRVPRRTVGFVQALPQSLPFRDGAFDLVISAGGMHRWPNPHAVLVEVERLLAEAGRYFGIDLRRDLNLGQWLLVRFVQGTLVPRDLRQIDEPSSSIGAAYTPQEAEWLAARAKLPGLRITSGPAWLLVEASRRPAACVISNSTGVLSTTRDHIKGDRQ
jgi:SAM-dependent methyltransferase